MEAIKLHHGVLSIKPESANINNDIAQERAVWDIKQRLWDALEKKH